MKIDRLVSIILLLLEKERIGAHELAAMFEVSARTIYRDIDAINMAGIPVLATPGSGGGFEIMKQYKLDKKVFSTADLSSILMGLSSLSSLMRGEELVNALAKVRSFIPADRAKDIELQADQLCIDLTPWLGNRTIPVYLETVKTALQERKVLSFDYADQHGRSSKRTAEPHQLVLKSSYWYVHAYCRTRNDFRLFKLSRMSSLRILQESFTMREHQKPQLDFSGELASMQTEITLSIRASAMDRVLDFCAPERVSNDGDYFIAAFPFIENTYYYNMILGFGPECECLDPPHVRAELKRRIDEMRTLYEH